MAAIIPFTDPHLVGGNSAAQSPFTIVFERVGFSIAASIMNAVVLTSVVSAANSGMYASTRMLYSLAKDGGAPKSSQKLLKRDSFHRLVGNNRCCIAHILNFNLWGQLYSPSLCFWFNWFHCLDWNCD